MTPRDVVAEHLPQVDSFISAVASADEGKDRHKELRRVSTLVRFLRTFYIVFLREFLEVQIQGFSYRDKRAVSRRLIRIEDEVKSQGDGKVNADLELAALFEDLSDLLHGDVEFGYSDEDDDFETFHVDSFPEWLDAVETWLRSAGDDALADAVEKTENEYRDTISESY